MALRQPRYLGILLSVSLAVNLFAAGAFFGGRFAQRAAEPMTDAAGLSFSGLVAALPDNVRDEARSVLDEREADIRRRLEALREAQAEAELAMLANPFLADALEAGLAEVRARGGDVQAALYEVVIDMVEGLDTADRAALAELLFAGTGGLQLAGRTGSTALAALD